MLKIDSDPNNFGSESLKTKTGYQCTFTEKNDSI